MMEQLTHNPALGHITTFGGNPVIAAAAHIHFQTLLKKKLMEQVAEKEHLFRSLLVHPKIKKFEAVDLCLPQF